RISASRNNTSLWPLSVSPHVAAQRQDPAASPEVTAPREVLVTAARWRLRRSHHRSPFLSFPLPRDVV
ncbi:unnamed protein product, partial [Urochloa humidicola]